MLADPLDDADEVGSVSTVSSEDDNMRELLPDALLTDSDDDELDALPPAVQDDAEQVDEEQHADAGEGQLPAARAAPQSFCCRSAQAHASPPRRQCCAW